MKFPTDERTGDCMNFYRSDEPTIISFSGGRTSGLMLRKTLDAYGGTLPDHIKVIFNNTGKEMPQTLEFVDRCAREWGVEIIWLERYAIPQPHSLDGPKFKYEVRQVSFETCARNGEPFDSVINERSYLPNPVARFCTAELKIRATRQYIEDVLGWELPVTTYLGIRADETRRAKKLHGKVDDGQENYCPLYKDGVTRFDVFRFWSTNHFDLALPNNNGVTDWGNCDLCFLKGASKKASIIRERPDLADWWIEQENKALGIKADGAFFRADQPSYSTMKIIATSAQPNFDFFGDDESIPCMCGD